MLFNAITTLAILATGVNAHFRLQYPEPRGPFVADIEVNFCGGYDNAVSNRTTFPLTGGFFTIQTGHPSFTVGALLSTEQNPTTFDDFKVDGNDQFVRAFAQEPGAGTFCIPLDIAAANIPGAVDGANVTIQIVFEGGDGSLYQCADLTLSSRATISNSTCKNATTENGHDDDEGEGESHEDDGALVQRVSGFVAAAMGLVALTAFL